MEKIRAAALDAIYPLSGTTESTKSTPDLLLKAHRAEAAQLLPPHYLVYFLLVELLEFQNFGKWEKLAWSVPVDYKGNAFLIEHRKSGVGIFIEEPERFEVESSEIVKLIQKGVTVAEPFFDLLAKDAVLSSKLNVTNRSLELFERFEYFLNLYSELRSEIGTNKDHFEDAFAGNLNGHDELYRYSSERQRQARWMAISAIDSFYSWTEHIFILIPILDSKITSGREVVKLANSDWHGKFKTALDIEDQQTAYFYEKLATIRRQLRNYMAHGAFGKNGQAFRFHSGAGAVPVFLPHHWKEDQFKLSMNHEFAESKAINIILEFVQHLWSGDRALARLYIQETNLPLILTMAQDGTYAKAMVSLAEMEPFVERLAWRFDSATNMDW